MSKTHITINNNHSHDQTILGHEEDFTFESQSKPRLTGDSKMFSSVRGRENATAAKENTSLASYFQTISNLTSGKVN